MLLHADQEHRESELAAAVASRARELLGDETLVSVTTSLPDEDGDVVDRPLVPTVVALLASPAAATDARLDQHVREARRRLVAVLPLWDPVGDFADVVPATARPLNGLAWSTPDLVAEELLRQLGISERQRKVFLSYRRTETSELAEQLREELGKRWFEVFLDRFSVPPAEDFQARLHVDLADKAFLLLLESKSARESHWVESEINFAKSNGLALMPVTMPGLAEEHLVQTVGPGFRVSLTEDQFTGAAGTALVDSALTQLLSQVERRHAEGLRLRREALLSSVSSHLRLAGFEVAPRRHPWAYRADHPDGRSRLYLVTPRAPLVSDLRELDDLLRHEGDDDLGVQGVLIHDTPTTDPVNDALIVWAVGQRPLVCLRVVDLPETLKP